MPWPYPTKCRTHRKWIAWSQLGETSVRNISIMFIPFPLMLCPFSSDFDSRKRNKGGVSPMRTRLYLAQVLTITQSRRKILPLCQGGRATSFVSLAINKMTFGIEVV